MRKSIFGALLLCFVLSGRSTIFAQSANGSISGLVQDTTHAVIPGVTITLTGTDTGVTSTALTTESGAYRFASVLPGTYKLSAALDGFKPSTLTGVTVGTSAQVRFDFTLELGAAAGTSVEVSVSSQQLLSESSASIAEVLTQERISALPLVSGEVTDLVKTMPGMLQSGFGDQFTIFTGLQVNTINTVRDGLSVTNGRNINGVSGTTTINPDLVGEIRIILTPVDAELGRGNGQVQISTRSGTNKFSGALVWNVRNSALNANSWVNNQTIDAVTGLWKPTPLDWQNTNQITGSWGGPIRKNKTFFYVLYDQNISRNRALVSNTVLTDSARQGILRYWSGWNPGNASQALPTFPASATTGVYASVDATGKPVAPLFNPDGSAYTGGLQCFSVFGNKKSDGNPFTSADCPGGTALFPSGSATTWDSLRPSFDTSGFIRKTLDAMPPANFFAPSPAGTVIDGLNLAQYRYVRGKSGVTGATTGTNPSNTNRKQINLKIDHIINPKNRFSVGWTLERDDNADNVANWPDALNGTGTRHPQVLTVNFTSTLSPTIVNEARFGISYDVQSVTPAWLSHNETIRKEAEAWLLQGGTNAVNGKVYPVLATPGAGNYAFGNGKVNLNSTYSGSSSPLYSYSDTLSSAHGHHAFKFGADVRLTRSNGFSGAIFPTVAGGPGANNSALGTTGLAGVAAALQPLQTTRTNAANMLYLLSGSVNTASTAYWVDSASNVTNRTWEDVTTAGQRRRIQVANEADFFAKDDWKVSKNLTLNLGLRWEYYGSPYVRGGFTPSIEGLGAGLFGAGRGNATFENWMAPGNLYLTGYGANVPASSALSCQNGVTQSALLPTSTCDPSKLTKLIFVGPDSPNPKLAATPNDYNNFGPAIGFAWQQGKMVIRGGYQITYGGSGRIGTASENLLNTTPGSTSTAALNTADPAILAITAGPPTRALLFSDIPSIVPVTPTAPALPAGQIPIYNRATSFTANAPNLPTPYVQNFTLSVTRNIGRNFSLDVRYVGTIGRKRAGTINLNQTNVYYNKELFDALTLTRAGGDSPLFDKMLAGLNLNAGVAGYGPVGTTVGSVLQTGSAALRRNATFTNNLAIGNFDAVASSLNTLVGSGTVTGLEASPITSGVGGAVLRNGCNRIADNKYDPNLPANTTTNIPTQCFSENYIVANPQLSAANYTAALGKSNYHSLQTQITMRPVQGISFQATYSWAKILGLVNGGYTDPLNRNGDYTYPYADVRDDFRTNGTFELPLGPNKLFFGNSSGWVARAIEKWQASVIFNAQGGAPRTIIAGHMFYAAGNQTLDTGQNQANIVSSSFVQDMQGNSQWNGRTGSYYGVNKWLNVPDPQCAASNFAPDKNGFSLAANCSLLAIAFQNPDGSVGPIALANPSPGTRGNMPMSLRALGKWRMDANLGKSFRISESKSLAVRIDATNVLNHPDLADPDPITGQSINTPGLSFGRITTKGGLGAAIAPRVFQAQLRFSF